jgi:hypothetical protein
MNNVLPRRIAAGTVENGVSVLVRNGQQSGIGN